MLKTIVSGGQTGADRGALDAALAAGFPCGGLCPRGRRAEDGRIPAAYPVSEIESADYIVRTRRNVEESDGTLIVARGALSGGTAATAAHARRTGRPWLAIDPDRAPVEVLAAEVAAWIADLGIETLNVAGPRASGDPAIHDAAQALVAAVIDIARGGPAPVTTP